MKNRLQRHFACAIAAMMLLFVLAGDVSAAWRPGLRGGFVTGSANKDAYPAVTNIYDGPFAATNYCPQTVVSATCPPVWANDRTWVFWGEVYIDGPKCCFAADVDDWTYLAIDGKKKENVYIDNSGWNSVDQTHPLNLPEGWHTFEVRFGNGGGGAGASGGMPVGFGIDREGKDTKDMADYEYPFDPMGSKPVVFRYDDGNGFADVLEITGEPDEYGEPVPAYGLVSDLCPGKNFTCSVSDASVEIGPGVKAVSTGWKLYDIDTGTGNTTLAATENGREFSYTHGNMGRRLVWQWAISNYVTIASSAGGAAEQKSQWVLDGARLALKAVPDDGYLFFRWTGDVPEEQAFNEEISLQVNCPITVAPQFVSAAGGYKIWTGKGDGSSWEDDANWAPARKPALGDDVHVSDAKILAETTIEVHSLEIAAGAELWLGASNTMDKAISLFPGLAKNYELNVTGNLSCSGTLVLGGEGETGTSTITVGGDFLLAKGANASVVSVAASSALEEDLRTHPTPFDIGGTFTVEEGATFYVSSDPLTGSHVAFTAADILIDGTLDAVKRGWDYTTTKPELPGFLFIDDDAPGYYSYAYGAGYSFWCGGGHGDVGGGSNGNFGKTYGNPYAPCLPGSPNGCHNKPARGGGVLRLHAEDSFTLNGTVDASGGNIWMYGASSGGSVWIEAARFEMDDEAVLRARGGSNDAYNSSGAGGRICVMVGLQPEEVASISTTGELPAGVNEHDFTTIGDVHGGRAQFFSNKGYYSWAPNGTSKYLNRSDSNVNIHISAEPAGVSTLEPDPAWGVRSFPVGIQMSLSTPASGADPVVDNAERYTCTECVVSNETGVVDGTSFVDDGEKKRVTIPETEKGPLWVTWLYGQKDAKTTVYDVTNGAVIIDGVTSTGDVSVWEPMGAELPEIQAVADGGYEFLFWTGGVPYGKAKENPIRLTMDMPRQIRPVFRQVQDPVERTWIVKDDKGEWLEPSNWNPAGIPGFEDDIVIPGGACNVSNYLECASLTLSGEGVLRLATGPRDTYAGHCWMSSVPLEGDKNVVRAPKELGEVALVVKNDLVMTNTAKIRLGVDIQPWRGRVEIGGDFRMEGENLAIFSAGPTNGITVTHVTGSGIFNVGGKLDIGAQARLMLGSDQVTGGSFVVRTKKLHVHEDGAIDASNRGYGYAAGSKTSLAPGWGYTYTIGGGYGGLGVGHNALYGHTYGQKFAPIEPGSPPGYHNQQKIAGGLIRVHADKAVIDGKLLATSIEQPYGGCSGGGIWLTARWIDFGNHAVLDASGATTGYDSKGGGGRIAIERGLSPAAIDHLAATGELPAGLEKNVLDALAFTNMYPRVTVDVTRGDHVSTPEYDGTFVYLNAVPSGTMLRLR